MKALKHLLPIALCPLIVLTGCGCSSSKKAAVEKAIANELDLLKKLDSETVNKYVDYDKLFPPVDKKSSSSYSSEDIFSIYFKDFDYSIDSVTLDPENKDKATASLLLTSIDAPSVAKDFSIALLKQEIFHSIEKNGDSIPNYQIFYNVLSSKEYETTNYPCSISLEKEKDGDWGLVHNYELEDVLTGGLLSTLSSDLLLPSEVVDTYFGVFLSLNEKQMATFLGINSNDASNSTQIASAIIEQLHKLFSYKIVDESIKGDSATVIAEFTTFDGNAINQKYQMALKAYLGSADAVIDGSDARMQMSKTFLIDAIGKNKETTTNTLSIPLTRNDNSWHPDIDSDLLSTALFGELSNITS